MTGFPSKITFGRMNNNAPNIPNPKVNHQANVGWSLKNPLPAFFAISKLKLCGFPETLY